MRAQRLSFRENLQILRKHNDVAILCHDCVIPVTVTIRFCGHEDGPRTVAVFTSTKIASTIIKRCIVTRSIAREVSHRLLLLLSNVD